MLKDITLGQYFPGETFVHRLDPRTKLLMTMVYIGVLLMAQRFLSLGIMGLFLALVVSNAQIKPKVLLKGLRPLLYILTFTALINVFFTPGEEIFRLWRIAATWEGVYRGILLILRIGLMVMGTFIMTYTTSPIAFTDGLESLLGPLNKIRVPVHELAMIMSMALRFVPTLIEETGKIMNAQKARGADFESGNIFRRAKALIPILVPLFVSAFRRADELAAAMESRCYHGGEGRTRMRKLEFAKGDVFVGIIAIGLIALIWYLG